MSWANPEYFWLLSLIPIYLIREVWKLYKRRSPSLTFSSVSNLRGLPGNYRSWLARSTPLIYLIGYTLLVVAMARPQLMNSHVEQSAEGIDIMISIDISTSMLAEDLQPNRLIAAKEVASDFISRRPSDRIGINVFARESFTVVPPTLDHNLVQNMLQSVDIGMVRDGTAIGMGIATSINRLRESEAVSKVIILLTDGMNNAGEVDPVTAGEMAASLGITLYTLGIGSRGTAPYPVDDPLFGRRYQNVQVNIDEEMLTQIAGITGGQYWRATDLDELIAIYDEIDQLERSEIDEIIYIDHEDLYPGYLGGGLLLIILAFINERVLTRSALFAE
ncbi:MAG TPA: VWA domain-containing protein [Balneolaceae bacterium]|nr:VWA domain-containing protein [Balneolaceae bacterium]